MLTRCPACATTFRVTPEQLKARAGKVRCGKCQAVFNALDSLAEAAPAAGEAPAAGAATAPSSPRSAPRAEASPAFAVQPDVPAPAASPLPPADVSRSEPAATEPVAAEEARKQALTDTATGAPQPDARDGGQDEEDDELDPDEAAPPATSEAIRDAALNAGLVAARETTEVPGYDKWAEGAFTAPVSLGTPASRPTWPFVLAALALLLALAGQLAYQFRSELAVASPTLRGALESACDALGCDIPLPRRGELVSIESSDLQVDPARGGMLQLAATLKNRAAFAQAWPLLEITLTDTQDNAVLRRVLQPADYLPAKVDPTVFPPNDEVAVKLWLDASGTPAAGYRLYVFYP